MAVPVRTRNRRQPCPSEIRSLQTAGYLNTSIFSPLSNFSHGLGWSAPNATYNIGADISLTQKLVSTTRYGYFFENYHDFGWPTNVRRTSWLEIPMAWARLDNHRRNPLARQPCSSLPAHPPRRTTARYTLFNADKHYQFNQDLAFFKGGWWGTHNFKFGYQLNHLVNVIDQNGNVP